MKIFYVITGLGMGGAETQVVALTDKMTDLGHEVIVISLFGEMVVKFKSSSIVCFQMNMVKTLSSFLSTYKLIRKLLRQYQPDVVHSHMVHANLMMRLIRLSYPIKRLICTAHSNNEGGKLRRFLYRLTNSLCDVFTNVSESAIKTFETQFIVKKNNMVCVHNGIDTEHFKFSPQLNPHLLAELEIEDNKLVFIAVGSFNAAKDYPNLINAYKKVSLQYKELHLIIVGDGPLKNEVETLIKTLGISEQVSLLGIRNDISKLMSAADFFVLSSAWEGFGLVVAEAMACELPVVATDCGGVKEVVGDYGLLSNPRDSLKLAEKMTQLIEMPCELRKKMSSNARQHIIKNYGLNEVVNKWLKIYSQQS